MAIEQKRHTAVSTNHGLTKPLLKDHPQSPLLVLFLSFCHCRHKTNSCLILQGHSYVFVGWVLYRGHVEKLNHLFLQTVLEKSNPWMQRMERTHRESQNTSATRLWLLLHLQATMHVTTVPGGFWAGFAASCHSQPAEMMSTIKQSTGPPLSRAHEEFLKSILSLQGQGEHSGCFRGRCRRAWVTQGAVAVQICCGLQWYWM